MDYIWNYISTWIVALAALAFYLYARWNSAYFSRRGVKNVPYSIPFVGHMLSVLMTKEHLRDMTLRMYRAFPDQKYVGSMQFKQPMYVMRDLNIIKQITIKDFDHFLNHVSTSDESTDPFISNTLFGMNGDRWKDMRATLSPVFTSSKMKNMFQYVEEIGRQMAEFYLDKMKEIQNKERGLIELDMRDAFTRYTNDVIATSVFGIRINSLLDRNNEFFKMGNEITNFNWLRMVKFFMMITLPLLSKTLNLSIFNAKSRNFFFDLVSGNMKERNEKNIIRQDMIQLLMEAKKGSLRYDTIDKDNDDKDTGFATVKESHVGKQASKRNWNNEEIVAQAMLFFFAGFETSSTLLCFLSHELTIHPDVQEKLQQEIDEVILKHGSKLDYNRINEMKYLDMVISETLRLWPPMILADRICTKSYQLPPPAEGAKPYKIQVGEAITIPIVGIHLDPKYYPDPQKFNPERFSEKNKHQIDPLAFLPFGIGPRNCIGSRFALMECKAVVFHLLAKFDFVQTAKTSNPLVLSKKTLSLRPENGFWFGIKPRFT